VLENITTPVPQSCEGVAFLGKQQEMTGSALKYAEERKLFIGDCYVL
jgi:hypothetical protein